MSLWRPVTNETNPFDLWLTDSPVSDRKHSAKSKVCSYSGEVSHSGGLACDTTAKRCPDQLQALYYAWMISTTKELKTVTLQSGGISGKEKESLTH